MHGCLLNVDTVKCLRIRCHFYLAYKMSTVVIQVVIFNYETNKYEFSCLCTSFHCLSHSLFLTNASTHIYVCLFVLCLRIYHILLFINVAILYFTSFFYFSFFIIVIIWLLFYLFGFFIFWLTNLYEDGKKNLSCIHDYNK